MRFFSLRHTDAPYRHAFGDQDIIGFGVHNQNESVGKVIDVLVDEMERSYYLVVERHSFLSQERFILPLTACKMAVPEQRIYVTELNKSQIKDLPTYRKENVTRYGGSSVSNATTQTEPLPLEASLPLEYSRPLEHSIGVVDTQTHRTVMHSTEFVSDSVSAKENLVEPEVRSPATPVLIERNTLEADPIAPVERHSDYVPGTPVEQHNIQLLAERLVVDRRRRKVGEVVVRKVVETQMVSVPVRRERLIVEQVSPEHKSLAAVDLDRGELSQDELRRLIPGASDNTIQAIANRVSVQTALPTETVPIHTAMQILHQVNQSHFKRGSVKLVFDDEELQQRYQRWLADHKS